MGDSRGPRLYRVLDRAFWLIWLGYPVMVWLLVRAALTPLAELEGLSEVERACMAMVPQVATFGWASRAVFFAAFGLEIALYAALLALAHRVVHRCATGRVLVVEMIGTLRWIGLLIAGWSVVSLIVGNLALVAFWAFGDAPYLGPDFALDLPVLGVGLLLLCIAAAMAQAVKLREDADLTI